jgi:hypothetical protein
VVGLPHLLLACSSRGLRVEPSESDACHRRVAASDPNRTSRTSHFRSVHGQRGLTAVATPPSKLKSGVRNVATCLQLQRLREHIGRRPESTIYPWIASGYLPLATLRHPSRRPFPRVQ